MNPSSKISIPAFIFRLHIIDIRIFVVVILQLGFGYGLVSVQLSYKTKTKPVGFFKLKTITITMVKIYWLKTVSMIAIIVTVLLLIPFFLFSTLLVLKFLSHYVEHCLSSAG